MLLLALTGCPEEKPAPTCDPADYQVDLPVVTPGAPQAGVAEAFLDLPVGVPLSGYTGRCTCFGGGEAKVDRRESAYTYEFAPSAGVQSRIPAKVLWLSNGQEDLVIIKTDLIYSFDGLVEEMERRIEAATGRAMDGRVVVATNHSHSSYGDFSDQVTYYLGSDHFNLEIYTRMADVLESTALEAYGSLAPAKLGVGFAKDWDPTDSVYHDRRGDNDDLGFFADIPDGPYKDPNLSLIRIDDANDQPLGILFAFGLHGTTLDGDNEMISVDAPGHIETVLQDRFDAPVMVALLQGAAGDASPSGVQGGYASLESTGEFAADAIYGLWEATPTSAAAIRLETASRSIPETAKDIHVTRNGTVDFRYKAYDEDYQPDNVVYEDEVRDTAGNLVSGGALLSPLDEFNTDYGEAFCGEDPPYLPGYAPAQVFPYDQCVEVAKMADLIQGFFDLTDEEMELPLYESRRAAVTATRIGPLPILEADGTMASDDVLVGFFPGETTALYTEQFRRRAQAELGFGHSIAVGYAQDHEGYLLLPEDWLTGGYEADINIWGPLQGEHIMEGLLTMAAEVLLTDEIEVPDPCGDWQPPDYPADAMPTAAPDRTTNAGTLLDADTLPSYIYTPLLSREELAAFVLPDVEVPAAVARVSGLVQMVWIGGDPGVDFPLVTLQRQDEAGEWGDVLTAAGRPVTGGPDILVTHTPEPLAPHEALQTHYWYAAWQAVGHVDARTGLEAGVYRLHVEGSSYVGSETTWPWTSEPYELDSDAFEVVAATLDVTVSETQVTASIAAPADGYRLVDLAGSRSGANPLEGGEAVLSFTLEDGTTQEESAVGVDSGGATAFDLSAFTFPASVVGVTVTDRYGNSGSAVR
jgi:neutral ceramidase